jgi:membrane protease subunit (stomatin/prohibitin family)
MKLLSKIYFNGDRDSVVWKHPDKRFQANSELIVPFTHEAILIKDGQARESFKPGKHVINEQPILVNRRKQECEYDIYYINKSANLPIKWGTHTQMDIFDPLLKIPVRIGAHGEFEIRIDNPRKFLIKVVGNTDGADKDLIQDFFRDKMGMYIKQAIADVMGREGISFYEISGQLKSLSDNIRAELAPEFDNYGVELLKLLIAGVVIPTEIKSELEKAFLERAKERIKEDYYDKVRISEKKEKVEVKPSLNKEPEALCPECGKAMNKGDKVCASCGSRVYSEGELDKPAEQIVEIYEES